MFHLAAAAARAGRHDHERWVHDQSMIGPRMESRGLRIYPEAWAYSGGCACADPTNTAGHEDGARRWGTEEQGGHQRERKKAATEKEREKEERKYKRKNERKKERTKERKKAAEEKVRCPAVQLPECRARCPHAMVCALLEGCPPPRPGGGGVCGWWVGVWGAGGAIRSLRALWLPGSDVMAPCAAGSRA